MIRAALFSLAIASVSPAALADANNGALEVTITGIADPSGSIRIALFDSEEGFKAFTPVEATIAAVTAGETRISLTDLPPGDYAISLYQDVNGNEELDRGRFGIPSEPYGFSNDAPVRFGPPKWSAASFSVSVGENSHTIALR